MKKIEECTVGIAGLGLMGGAFAMAFARLGVPRERLLACDADARTLASAKDQGLVAEGSGEARLMLPRCDLVFLCLNPSSLLRFLAAHQGDFKSGALVTDIAGIKGSVVLAAERFRPDVDFIPGHPMAGSEKGGFDNAGHCDFRGKNYILTPLARNTKENLAFLEDLLRRMGFGRITRTTAGDHDEKIAFTSQLCHVIAAALVDCADDPSITRFGGGSFEDLTRIAMLNAPMWTELFIENREKLLEHLRRFRKSLDAIGSLAASGDAQALEKILRGVREKRSAMNG
ncbi:MAG: prephenate dehydrogenase [Treponema sp.]|jgi:prephenate dehydrogenase|nr:prephenate dehydrogenase [Treponema sp.]